MKIHGWKGVFSFSRPKTSTMVTFLKIRRQQWNRHLVSKRAQCSFVTVNTILVRSSFKGARISKTIHTLKSKPSETTRMPIFPSFFPHNTLDTCNHQRNWSKVNPLRIVSRVSATKPRNTDCTQSWESCLVTSVKLGTVSWKC